MTANHILNSGLLGMLLYLSLTTVDGQPLAEQKLPKIGILRPVSTPDSFTEAFRQGLQQLGYVEGQNILVEYRFAAGKEDHLTELAADLVRLNVDVIVISSTPAARAAQSATKTVPIIFVAVSDPIQSGLVASLGRPGGNITGFTTEPTAELSGKRLELLKELAPVSKVAILNNPANPASAIIVRETLKAAQKLDFHLRFLHVSNAKDIERAFKSITRSDADALAVLVDPLFVVHKTTILRYAAKKGLPAIYPWREFVDAGGLMSVLWT